MSTTTDKIDPTVTLDKLIALLQGFRDKLTADGNSDTVSRVEALGDEETQSKYYNKFGGGRALAGAILDVDGKIANKADDLRIVLSGIGNASADTIEGVAFNSWVNVPPEFEIDMSGDIGSKLWMPGASFAIPHLDSGNPVDFPITGWQHDETDSQKSTATLRPFYASDGKLVRGTVEAQLSTSTNSYTLHFRWEYAQSGGNGGGEADIDAHTFVINCDSDNTMYSSEGYPWHVRVPDIDNNGKAYGMQLWDGLVGAKYVDGSPYDFEDTGKCLYDKICFVMGTGATQRRLTLPIAYFNRSSNQLYLGAVMLLCVDEAQLRPYGCIVTYNSMESYTDFTIQSF